MALTDTKIKALKPRAARYLESDGRGLSLDVLPSGKMTWLYRYRLNGSYGKVTLGRYPDLTLKAAREKRDELAAVVALGRSPADERPGRARKHPVNEAPRRERGACRCFWASVCLGR